MQNVAFLPDIKRPEPGPGEFAGLTAQVGDLVRWKCPRSLASQEGVVEIVYTLQGKAAVITAEGRGHRISLLDAVVTRRAGQS